MQFSEILSAALASKFSKTKIQQVGPFQEEGNITFTYKIEGKKNAPEMCDATVTIPWKLVVANLIDLIGKDAEAGMELLGEAINRSFEQTKRGEKNQPDHLREMLKKVTSVAEQCVNKLISMLPKLQKDGKTFFYTVELEVLDNAAKVVKMPTTTASDAAEAV